MSDSRTGRLVLVAAVCFGAATARSVVIGKTGGRGQATRRIGPSPDKKTGGASTRVLAPPAWQSRGVRLSDARSGLRQFR